VIAGAQSCFPLLAAEPLSAARERIALALTWTTSPLKTRARNLHRTPSGRLSRRRRSRPMFTPGSRACGYRTASGRAKWLNRDPIEERGGINLYGFVRNNPVCEVDPFGYVLFGPPELGQPGPKPPPSPSDPEPGWEWLPKEGPLKFCRKGQRRDCDMEMAFCIGRGQIFCSLVGRGGAAYRFCMSVYASACYVQRSQCQSWNTDNGFSP
jgi:hypothetical protein